MGIWDVEIKCIYKKVNMVIDWFVNFSFEILCKVFIFDIYYFNFGIFLYEDLVGVVLFRYVFVR